MPRTSSKQERCTEALLEGGVGFGGRKGEVVGGQAKRRRGGESWSVH